MPGSSYEVVAAYEAVVIGGQYGAHMLSPRMLSDSNKFRLIHN